MSPAATTRSSALRTKGWQGGACRGQKEEEVRPPRSHKQHEFLCSDTFSSVAVEQDWSLSQHHHVLHCAYADCWVHSCGDDGVTFLLCFVLYYYFPSFVGKVHESYATARCLLSNLSTTNTQDYFTGFYTVQRTPLIGACWLRALTMLCAFLGVVCAQGKKRAGNSRLYCL